jgi:hypothetical protein
MAKGTEARPGLADVVDIRTRARLEPGPIAPAQVSLAPSDFAFLWNECPRCFYRKVLHKDPRPRSPFPKVFGTIDRAMKAFYLGRPTEVVAPGMPAGVIEHTDRWVRSVGLTLPGGSVVSEIRGSLDALVHCDDDTLAVVDFKTAEPNADHAATYSRQLHAYALALEQPCSGPAATVSALGLLCFLPDVFGGGDLPDVFGGGDMASLTGQVEWFAIERDDQSFFRFLIEVASVLEEEEPPPASPTCMWCRWRTAA